MKSPVRSIKQRPASVVAQVVGNARLRRPIPRRWRWHYQALLALRDRFLQERSERRAEAGQPLEPHSMSEADSATDEFDHDLALRAWSAGQVAISEVDRALDRILKGTYGICEESGKVISAARLRAVPWTRYVQEVEASHERNGETFRATLGKIGSVRDPLPNDLEPAETDPEDGTANPAAKDEDLERIFSPAPARPQARPRLRTAPLKKRSAPKKRT